MARYNSVNTTGSVAGGNSISTPYSGLLTTITSGGTITVPNPTYYAGAVQTFYNATGGSATLSSPSGTFVGVNASGLSTQVLASTAIITIVSDGTNYIVQDFLGGPVTATALTVSGALTANPNNASISLQPTGTGNVTISPAAAGTIDNMNIGATTQGTGKFSSLSATGVLSTTSNTASTSTATGALQVSGGAGIAGNIFAGGNIMIGTGSPGAPLSFQDQTGVKIQLNADAANRYAIEKQAAVNSGDSMLKYNAGQSAAGEHGFYSGNALRVLINASGWIGVGTASPSLYANNYSGAATKRVITIGNPSADEIPGIRLQSMASTSSSSYEIWADSSALRFDTMNSGRDFAFNTTGSTSAQVWIKQATGYMGIGNNAPTNSLDITAAPATNTATANNLAGIGGGITITSNSNGTASRVGIIMRGSDNIGGGIAVAREDAGSTWGTYMAFYTNSVTSGSYGVSAVQEKLRISGAGVISMNAGTVGTAGIAFPTTTDGTLQTTPPTFMGYNWKFLGAFTLRNGSTYLDIQTNFTGGMVSVKAEGYLYNQLLCVSYSCGYTYTGNQFLARQDLNLSANTTMSLYRSTASPYYMGIRFNRGTSSYSEGQINVYINAWDGASQNAISVLQFAQNNTASQYY